MANQAKTAIKIQTSTAIYAAVAIAAVTTAIAVGIGIFSGSGFPAVAPSLTTNPDLILKNAIFVGLDAASGNPKFTFKFCNNGISLNDYYNSPAGSAFTFQWLTYNDSGLQDLQAATSMGGDTISKLANGACTTMTGGMVGDKPAGWAVPLSPEQLAQYGANQKIIFKVDPGNAVVETNEANNNFMCAGSTCTREAYTTLGVTYSATVPAGTIVNANNQSMAAFTFVVKGQPISVETVTFGIIAKTATSTSIASGLTSFQLVAANGTILAGPTDLSADGKLNFTDKFTLPIGSNILTLKADVSGWQAGDSFRMIIDTPATAIRAISQVSGGLVAPKPITLVRGPLQTIKGASLAVSRNAIPADNTPVIKGSTDILLGSWTLDAKNSGEDIKVTRLAIRAATNGKINDLTLKDGTTILHPINSAPVAGVSTSTFALSNPLIIPKGAAKTINLYGSIGSDSQEGDIISFGLTSAAGVTAYGATTGNSAAVSVTANDGATLIIKNSGTLIINLDSSSAASSLVVAGTGGVVVSDIRLKAINEAVDVTKLVVRVADGGIAGTAAGDYTQIAKLHLYTISDHGDIDIIGNPAGYSLDAATRTIYLERGDLTIPEGAVGKKLRLAVDVALIGTNQPGTANADIKVGISSQDVANIDAYGNQSNAKAAVEYVSGMGSAVIIHKSVPAVVIETPANPLSGSATLHRVRITAVGGAIGLYGLTYSVSTSSNLNVFNGSIQLNSCSGCGGIASGTVLARSFGRPMGLNSVWEFKVDAVNAGKYYLPIAQGATAVIDFIASVAGQTAAATDLVSTSLLGELTAFSASQAATAYHTFSGGNFVWSDLNVNGDSASAASLSASQWYGGYLVYGMSATTTPVTVHD